MPENKKKVSVVVATYNHEKYIAHALESIISQKVDFDYEVLVGEDCSTDNTAEIVKKYADMYPDIIVPFIREKNLGIGGNVPELMTHISGEYVSFIEGDDYWIDDHKLQKQVDFMDSHPDYVACFGKCIVVDENDIRHPEYEQYSSFKTGVGDYRINEFEEYVMPGQTATSMYRVVVYGDLHKKIMEANIDVSKMIDRTQILCMLALGKMYVFGDTFSAYRYILNPDSGSWSSKNDVYQIDSLLNYLRGMKDMEEIAKALDLSLDFDNRRTYEVKKLYSSNETFSNDEYKIIKQELKKGYNNKYKYYIALAKILIRRML